MRYWFHRAVGRKNVWRSVAAPPLTSPPTSFGLYRSISAAVRTDLARIRSRKPGANRSIWASIRSDMSTVEPDGTWQ